MGKETLRFCTMNDLLRQAHPNTLVPGGGRAPFAPTKCDSRICNLAQAAQGRASLIHRSLFTVPLAGERCRVRMTMVKRLIVVPSAARRPRDETVPSFGASKHSSIQCSLLGEPVPASCLALCGRWPGLVLQHGSRPVLKWPAKRLPGWTAAVVRLLLARYIFMFGDPYDQGKFEPNRACTRRRYLTSCASLVVGRKVIEGLQRFQPEHHV